MCIRDSLLQRVNDDEVGVGMLGDELLDLLQQPVRQSLGEGGEVQILSLIHI